MNDPQTLDELAEERLDGVLDEAAWLAASAQHGAALDRALARAAACREALAPSAAALPGPVRDRLLMAVAARRPRTSTWWWPMAAAAAAACVTFVWVLTRTPTATEPASMPMLAIAENAPLAGSAPMASQAAPPQSSPQAALNRPQATPEPGDLAALQAGMATLRQEAETLAKDADAALPRDASGRADVSTLGAAEAEARLARTVPPAAAAKPSAPMMDAAPAEATLAVNPRLTLVPPPADLADEGKASGSYRSRAALLADTVAQAPWIVHVDPLGGTLVLGPDDLRIEALDATGKVLASATTGWILTITAPTDLPIAAPPRPAGTASLRARLAK